MVLTASRASDSEDKREKPKRGSSWRLVDPDIWTRRSPPAKGLRRIGLFLWSIISIFFNPLAVVVLAPPLAGWAVALSFFLAYRVGGVNLFGPVVLGIWAAIAAIGVFAIQRTGYARNFEGWDFKMRNTLLLLPAFLLCAALIYFIIFLAQLGS